MPASRVTSRLSGSDAAGGGAGIAVDVAARVAAWRGRPELFALTLLAVVTRFWGLLSPREVVWDEVYYERFAGSYFARSYYVDVHPPLGKLIFAGAAKLLGISGLVLFRDQPAPLLRVVPALAGTLIIPVVYLLLRELGGSRRTATFGALLLLADNAMLVESRIIVPDMIMVLAGMTALLAYAVARRSTGAPRYAWIAGAAAAAGVAVSIKWTGLSALGLIALVWIAEAWRDRGRRRGMRTVISEAVLLAVIPAAIYLAAFAVHFTLLGTGGDSAVHGSFVRSFIGLNRQMQSINLGWNTATHAGASPWYTWPIAKHSLGYWNDIDPYAGTERWIVLFGNPVVWWGVLCGALVIAVALIRRSAALASRHAVLVVLGVGYVANFVPFAFIQRPMFLYHYLFAFVFSVLFVSVGLGALAGWDVNDDSFWRFPSAGSARLFVGAIGAAAIFFLYLMPISCGWRISAAGMTHRRWILERHAGT